MQKSNKIHLENIVLMHGLLNGQDVHIIFVYNYVIFSNSAVMQHFIGHQTILSCYNNESVLFDFNVIMHIWS